MAHEKQTKSCCSKAPRPLVSKHSWNGCHLIYTISVETCVEIVSSEELHLRALSSPSCRYTGAKPTTNMVLVDIKLLSGFTADTSLVRMRFNEVKSQNTWSCFRCNKRYLSSQLGSPPDLLAPLVQRVDSGEDRVLVYLKEVSCTSALIVCVYFSSSFLSHRFPKASPWPTECNWNRFLQCRISSQRSLRFMTTISQVCIQWLCFWPNSDKHH